MTTRGSRKEPSRQQRRSNNNNFNNEQARAFQKERDQRQNQRTRPCLLFPRHLLEPPSARFLQRENKLQREHSAVFCIGEIRWLSHNLIFANTLVLVGNWTFSMYPLVCMCSSRANVGTKIQ